MNDIGYVGLAEIENRKEELIDIWVKVKGTARNVKTTNIFSSGKMCSFTLEDKAATIHVVVFPHTYRFISNKIKNDEEISFIGRVFLEENEMAGLALMHLCD